MRMKVWGEISGVAPPTVWNLGDELPGREEQFSYAESYLENEAAQPLSALLPLRGRATFPKRQTDSAPSAIFFPEGGALAAVAKTLEVKGQARHI